ncbi:MAG: glycosyltransferase family 1 protein [candidate division WOR-3 bacterium]
MKTVGILAFSDKFGGGVYQYTQSIIDALKKDKTGKHRYIIFCNEGDDRFDNYGFEVRKLNRVKNSLPVKILRAFQLLLLIRRPLLFSKQEYDMFKDIDIFLSPAISAYPHFYMNKPFIFTLHDMQERYFPEFFTFKERLIRWLNNRALAKTAWKIICESNYVKNDIIKFTGVDKNKIFVITSPPPAEFLNYHFNEERFQLIRKKYNLPEKYIFYPAQAWFHKNHIRLVEAFKIVNEKHPDIYLILTGSQQNNYHNLMKRINELNINHRVKHLGYVDYDELPYLYKMSLFLVMPSLFESVSIPIYEAFALGVAVCSSNVVALPEQVGDAGLLFDPYNVQDIAEKMLIYLEDEGLRKEKAMLGYRKIAGFNHDVYLKRLLEVLDDNPW